MKKILVLTTTYPTFLPGDGTPPFVHELSRRVAALWTELLVLTPRRPGTKTTEIQDWVKIIRYPYFFSSSRELLADGAILPNLQKKKWLYIQIPFLCLWCLWALIFVVRKHAIQIIHAHWVFMNGCIAAIYKKVFNKQIKIVITSHWSDLHSLHGWIIDRLKKRTVQQADKVTVVSAYLKKKLDELMGQETTAEIIPMWVDEEYFTPTNFDKSILETYGSPEKLFVFVGRLAKEKWVIDLIEAMPFVVQKEPACKLLIIWHGPLSIELKNRVEELNLSEYIVFVGALPNTQLNAYYATADLCIMPSYKEGSPVVLIEALFSGATCIGRDIEQIVEVKNNWWMLLLFHTQDELIQAMITWKRGLNTDTSKLMKSYSWKYISLSYVELLCAI